MYENYFNFNALPFTLLPDQAMLFPSRRHKQVMTMLDYGLLSQAGFIVITGDVGAGKTTVLRRFMKGLDRSVVIGMITNPSTSFSTLLKWVAHAFDIENAAAINAGDTATLYQAFVAFLLDQYAAGRRVVLVIDEAQNMPSEMLEELRMLSNVNNEKDMLLQMVLVGQPELLETLKRDNLRQFVQRISAHCHLNPLDAEETRAYIHHRLFYVGGRKDLFDEAAMAAIYYFASGVPRLINMLADQALIYAFGEDATRISLEMIFEVTADRARSGLSPYKPLPKPQTLEALALETKDIHSRFLTMAAQEKA
ncbi:MAG: AAA family ATPase [Alphaproteobacteria bacterium]|nr:AAA family ATPase [Alphaproteobacteria bacterium]